MPKSSDMKSGTTRALHMKPLLLIFWLTVLGPENIWANSCETTHEICRVRRELALDFPDYAKWKCASVINCVCLEGMSVVYYSHPPYIFFSEKNNKTVGLLDGKRIHVYP